MKIRTDFVTNSSSSSYIIGKYEDMHVTVEFVYQLIRSLHMEALEIQKKITEYIGTDEWTNICFERSAADDETECVVSWKHYFIDRFEVNINEPPYSKWYSFLKKIDEKSTVRQYTVCVGACNMSRDDIDFVCEIYDHIKKEAIDKNNIDIVKTWCDEPDQSGKTILVIEYWAQHCGFTVNKNSAPVKELLALIGDEETHISKDFWKLSDLSCIEHETYEDYIKFAEKLSFWIIDYTVPKETKDRLEEESTDSFSAVLGWYNDEVQAAFCSMKKGKDCATCKCCEGRMNFYNGKDIPLECKRCIELGYPLCPSHIWTNDDGEIQQLLNEIHRCRELIKEKNIPEKLACLYFLGRVCVFSWESVLNFWVAEKLEQMAEYGCSHMG